MGLGVAGWAPSGDHSEGSQEAAIIQPNAAPAVASPTASLSREELEKGDPTSRRVAFPARSDFLFIASTQGAELIPAGQQEGDLEPGLALWDVGHCGHLPPHLLPPMLPPPFEILPTQHLQDRHLKEEFYNQRLLYKQ